MKRAGDNSVSQDNTKKPRSNEGGAKGSQPWLENGTLLENIPKDLHNLITSYGASYKDIVAVPLLKPSYKIQSVLYSRRTRSAPIPGHLAVSPCGGYYYFTHALGARIFGFKPDSGELVFCIESIGLPPAPVLTDPQGLVIDKANNLVCCDQTTGDVWVYDRLTGARKRTFGGSDVLSSPAFIAVDQFGNYFITDTLQCCVQVFTPDGVWVKKIGQPGDLASPTGIAVTLQGDVIVAEKGNHRVQIFSAEGKSIRTFGAAGSEDGNFSFPHGVAVDRDGKIIICDTGNSRLQFFSPQGVWLMKIGGVMGRKPGELIEPHDVVLDRNGNLWVSEIQNERVQLFD